MARWNRRRLAVALGTLIALALAVWLIFNARQTEAPTMPPKVGSTTSTPSLTSAPPTASASTPATTPLQPSPTLNRAYGIAAGSSLTRMPERELNLYLDEAVKLGGAWIRFDIDWSRIEGEGPGRYDWTATDRVVAAARERGLSSLAVIGYSPRWAAAQGCDSEHCAPRDPADYGRFAGVAAGRYRDQGLRHFEIWNEPNVSTFFAPKPSAPEYAELLASAAREMRAANPKAVILSGGTAPAATDGSNIAPLDFVTQLYDLGAGRLVDAVAHHPYTYPYMPSNAYPGGAWDDLGAIHRLMASRGDGAKTVWATEYGAPTGGKDRLVNSEVAPLPAGDPVSERLQATMAADALAQYRQLDWAGPLMWYSLSDSGRSPVDPEDHFGLIRTDSSYKPAYAVVKQAWE